MDYYDYYFTMVIAVKLELEKEFLEKLSEADRKVLEENPNGIVERDDGDSRLPNQTFVKNGYKVFVRRLEDDTKVYDNIAKIYNEYLSQKNNYAKLDFSFTGFLVYLHVQHANDLDPINYPSLDTFASQFSPEIIFTLTSDYSLDRDNKIDYSYLESCDKTNTRYAAIAIIMEQEVSKHFHKILPDKLREFLKTKSYYNEKYGEYEDEGTLYILFNVPFLIEDEADEVENFYIGQELVKFLSDNIDDLSEYGCINAFVVPQVGILTHDDCINEAGNIEFKTPMSNALELCDFLGEENDISLYIGDTDCYANNSLHFLFIREINFPVAKAKDNKTGSNTGNNAENDSNTKSINDSFRDYLIAQGYKEYTDAGKTSTVYDYIKRVETVCKEEGLNWDTLAESINRIVEKYNRGGEKEKMGRQSHDTVINALKAYQRFIESSKGSTSSYKPVEADQCISFFIKSKFIKDLLNALEVADKNFFENTNEAEGPVFEISEDVSSMRWHYPEENPLKPETVIKAVQCIPSENWLLHMCPQYGIDGPCQSIGTLSVPDAIFEYEFYFESDKYPEDITFEDVDNKIPMNIIGCALSPEGAKAFAENLPDGIKESLEPLTAFHLFEEVTGEIGIYLNVPAGNTSMSEKLENIFSKIDPTTYTLFVIPQTGFIDEWQFSNTFPGGMKAAIYGALEDMPFDFSLRQYC